MMAINMKAVAKTRPAGKMTLIPGIEMHAGATPLSLTPALYKLVLRLETGAELMKRQPAPSDIGFSFCSVNFTDFCNDAHSSNLPLDTATRKLARSLPSCDMYLVFRPPVLYSGIIVL
jgi:hypothetical protein